MTRSLSATQKSFLENQAIIGILLIEIGISDGSTDRFTDNPFDITFNGETYLSNNKIIQISETQEKAEINISNINIVISAIDTANITRYANSTQINQTVTIRRAFMSTVDNQLIGDSALDESVILFEGRIAGYQLANNQSSAEILMEVTSQFANFRKRNGRRTNTDNWSRFAPQDNFMEFAHESVRDIKWGIK